MLDASLTPLDEQTPSDKVRFFLLAFSAFALLQSHADLLALSNEEMRQLVAGEKTAFASAEKLVAGLTHEERFFLKMHYDDKAFNG